MGRVTICKYKRTVTPYVVGQTGTHLYSLEEMAWFLYHNLFLIDRQMFDERLCRWLQEEIEYPELANRIRSGLRMGSSFQNLVISVAGAVDLFSKEELSDLGDRLKNMSALQEQERRKLRADELLDNGSERAALEEYRRILRMHQNQRLGMAFYGAVWHNLGVCYARQFQFAKAAECFDMADEYSPDEDTRRQAELAASLAAGHFPKGKDAKEELRDPQKKLLEWEREYRRGSSYESGNGNG